MPHRAAPLIAGALLAAATLVATPAAAGPEVGVGVTAMGYGALDATAGYGVGLTGRFGWALPGLSVGPLGLHIVPEVQLSRHELTLTTDEQAVLVRATGGGRVVLTLARLGGDAIAIDTRGEGVRLFTALQGHFGYGAVDGPVDLGRPTGDGALQVGLGIGPVEIALQVGGGALVPDESATLLGDMPSGWIEGGVELGLTF